MDVKQCKLFVITAETRKISKTAELTGYTQSGVSHILKAFEKEVGVPLFQRDRYGVHLTPMGTELLGYVKRFLAENDRLEQYICDLHGLEVGNITIGTFSSVSQTCLPDILRTFREAHPSIEINIREGGSDDMEQWVGDMSVDLAFYSLQPQYPYEFIHLMNDPLVAVLPPEDMPLARRTAPTEQAARTARRADMSVQSVALAVDGASKRFPRYALNGQPFILTEDGDDHDVRRMLLESSAKPNVIFSTKDDATILAMVEKGLGMAVVPRLSTLGRPGRYRTMMLEPQATRDLGIAIKSARNASPIVRSFIYATETYFEKWPEAKVTEG